MSLKKEPSSPLPLDSREASFHLFFHLNPLPVFLYARPSYKIILANEAAALKYGYSLEEMNGMPLSSLCPDSGRDAMMQKLSETMAAGKSMECECRHRKKNGSQFSIKAVCYPVIFDGQDAGISIAFEAVDDASAVSALRDLEKKFHAFMKYNPATAWIKDENFRYIYGNPTWEKIVRGKIEDLFGKSDFDLFPEDIARQLREHDQEVLRTGAPITTVESVPGPDGTMRYWMVSKFVVHGPEGKRYIGGEAYDTTEQRMAQQKIRFQASLLNEVRNAVVAVDLENRIVYWNRYAEVMHQWTAEEAAGKNIIDLIVPEDFRPRAGMILSNLKTHGHWEGEFLLMRKNGQSFPAFIGCAALTNPAGEITGFIGISTDLGDVKAAQKALEDKNIALKEILGQLELEKRDIRDRLAGNIDKMVFPVLKKIRKKLPSSDMETLRTHLDLLEKTLLEVAAPLSTQLASKLKRLTQKELEICNLLRSGLTSKEIARMLEISPATVETHRVRIRRKLKIDDRTINLASFLQTS